jgi:hypothetical protein
MTDAKLELVKKADPSLNKAVGNMQRHLAGLLSSAEEAERIVQEITKKSKSIEHDLVGEYK